MSWGRTNRLIIAAAERLGVDASPLTEAVHTDFLMRLTPRDGGPGVVISKTRSPFLTQVAQTLSNNKLVSRARLAAHGVPVVEGVIVDDDDDDPRTPPVAALLERCGAVIVKPNWGNRARGLSGPHRSLDAVARACRWAQACDRDSEALVERFVPGTNLRVSVIGGRAVAAAEIQRPILRGAESCAAQIAALNRDPRRARAHEELLGLDVMPAGDIIAPMLEVHGLALAAAPPAGASIELYSEEREIIDRTDELDPGWGALAERACSLLGVDVGGVDLRGPLAAFTRPPGSSGEAVLLEVNVLPALHLHALPTQGKPRPVFEAFVAYCLSLPGAPPPRAVVGV